MRVLTFPKLKYPFLFNFNLKFNFILANIVFKPFDFFYLLKNISFTEKIRINKSIPIEMVCSL